MNPMSLLTVAEASVEIGIPVDDLDRLRRDGRGPKHLSIAEAGQILYRRYDLLEWVKLRKPAPSPPPETEWTSTQKDAVYEFARFLQKKMGLAKPRIYIEYADEFVGEKPVPIEPPRREP